MRMEDTPYDAAMTRSKQELARQVVDANARIEALEAALREITELTNASKNTTCNTCRKAGVVARAALAPEQNK